MYLVILILYILVQTANQSPSLLKELFREMSVVSTTLQTHHYASCILHRSWFCLESVYITNLFIYIANNAYCVVAGFTQCFTKKLFRNIWQGKYFLPCICKSVHTVSIIKCTFFATKLGLAFEKNPWLYIVGASVKISSQYPCESQDSNLYCHNGSKAVDGIYAPIGVHEYTSIAHTEHETNPWIQIDLGKSLCISAVKIWNRNMDGAGRHF